MRQYKASLNENKCDVEELEAEEVSGKEVCATSRNVDASPAAIFIVKKFRVPASNVQRHEQEEFAK